jgi:uncharacterized Zn-finger protein
MRTHNGERSHICTFCGKSFTENQGLKAHIRTHTGEKPYICNICGHGFAQSGALATHRKIHKIDQRPVKANDAKLGCNAL